MGNVNNWHAEVLGNNVVQALKKNYFDAMYVESSEEAAEYILEHVKSGDKVGFGGSDTISTLRVQERIKELGAEVLDHNLPNLSPKEKLDIRRAQLTSDLFLCSSNAVTLNGELVNVDGAGNRVAAMTFGPKKVIVVVGVNKICTDEAAAFERIKLEAAPKNTKRLATGTSCNEMGFCMDCRSEKRICRVYSVIKRKPLATDITVVVVGDRLGY
ncbi:lactate utilization protein [Clostridium bovifaecis]|uniref:Lactate utilization protein n=1 Tax=Clostridium bovifaecis TaxID=2184719 RepID=A0A6I6ETN6_9CLOT|nr:lactate utilization protein [Clostridium bovifaecis]